MPIRFACPNCQAEFSVADNQAGKTSLCGVCKNRLQVPTPRLTTPEPVAEKPAPVRTLSVPPPLPPKPTAPPRTSRRERPEEIKRSDAEEVSPDAERNRQIKQFVIVVSLLFMFAVGGLVIFLVATSGTSPETKPALVEKKKSQTEVAARPKQNQFKSEPTEVIPPKAKEITPIIPPPKPTEEPPAKRGEVLSGEEVYRRLVQSAALIVLERGMGTGFVVQREKGLLMTNAHVVGRETNVVVIFPRYSASGELLTELRDYGRAVGLKGKVLEVDTRRDLAVIQVAEIPATTKAVTFAPKGAEPGSNVFSVGGSGTKANLLWRLTKGTVRGRSERKVQTQAGLVACTVLETDSPLNPGDSGGPMMNERGELVAVVSHGDTDQQQISGNIDLVEVQQVLRRYAER